MNYWLHPDAQFELEEAAVYYAAHASVAVAQAFLAEFDRVIALLVQNPMRGSPVRASLRRYHFRRFPYTVIYAQNPTDGPQVFAVFHQSRAPDYWRARA
jgi:plasmid stabilization system protein ParE